MNNSSIHPGNLIEWVYTHDNIVVGKDNKLWSTLMHLWVPIGVPSLLISITEHEYSWLSEKRLFSARVDDTYGNRRSGPSGGASVAPRKCVT